MTGGASGRRRSCAVAPVADPGHPAVRGEGREAGARRRRYESEPAAPLPAAGAAVRFEGQPVQLQEGQHS